MFVVEENDHHHCEEDNKLAIEGEVAKQLRLAKENESDSSSSTSKEPLIVEKVIEKVIQKETQIKVLLYKTMHGNHVK